MMQIYIILAILEKIPRSVVYKIKSAEITWDIRVFSRGYRALKLVSEVSFSFYLISLIRKASLQGGRSCVPACMFACMLDFLEVWYIHTIGCYASALFSWSSNFMISIWQPYINFQWRTEVASPNYSWKIVMCYSLIQHTDSVLGIAHHLKCIFCHYTDKFFLLCSSF